MRNHPADSPTPPDLGLLERLLSPPPVPVNAPADSFVLSPIRHYAPTSFEAIPAKLGRPPADDEMPAGATMSRQFLQLAKRLAELYHLAFPEKGDWLDETIAWGDDEAVAQATEQFLNRVNSHRFPVDTDIIDIDADACEWVLWHAPVLPLGFAAGYAEEWEYIREPVQLLIKLTYGDCLDENAPVCLADDYPNLVIPDGFSTNGLSKVLREMNLAGPLAALPDMLAMVQEETGNAWLDYAYSYLAESGGFPNWETDYEWLVEDWAEARPIADQVFALIDWVEESLDERLKLVMGSLVTAHTRRHNLNLPTELSPLRACTITAEAFVAGNWMRDDE